MRSLVENKPYFSKKLISSYMRLVSAFTSSGYDGLLIDKVFTWYCP